MYEIEFKNSFKKDFKLAIKRGLQIHKFEDILIQLRNEGKVTAKYKPHKLYRL